MIRFDRRLFEHFDMVLLLLILLVCTMAFFNLYSASFPPKDGTAPYVRQGYFFAMAFVAFIVVISFDYQILHTWNYPLYVAIIILLILAETIGNTAGGAQRWINLGFFKLQPSEPAKLMLIITLASYFSRREASEGYSIKDLLVPGVLTAVPFILILIQPDLGTAMMLVIIAASMAMFVKLRFSTYLILGSLAVGLGVFAWEKILKPYQKQRIFTFLEPEKDPMGHGYQVLQSKIAIGSGGKFGKGYLEGTQGHLHFLPERHTDFAFSVWGEEWGFAGSVLLLSVYFLLILWGMYVAMHAKDRFGVLLAYGVSVLIFWQAVINLCMVLGFMPVVGIPLPLFSYGGSSLMTTMAALAILMNVRMRRFPNSLAGE
jgi:rod shape determining protein RodA